MHVKFYFQYQISYNLCTKFLESGRNCALTDTIETAAHLELCHRKRGTLQRARHIAKPDRVIEIN